MELLGKKVNTLYIVTIYFIIGVCRVLMCMKFIRVIRLQLVS